mmetsp:Transcript_7973/g.20489  ORF Transcript_7973/g.20489 Transcript_7973/m.20489 type:complete len:215 (+) Transcript_7973:657-1301(+)
MVRCVLCVPAAPVPGVWNCATLHCDVMYLGVSDCGSTLERKDHVDLAFSAASSCAVPFASSSAVPGLGPAAPPPGAPAPSEKTWTVPWSELTASHEASMLKEMLWMSACSAPRRSSCSACPVCESHTRMSVPRSDAVASRVPSRLSARHESVDSCADINVGRRMSKSSTRRWPFCKPGQASTHVFELGLSAHKPFGLEIVSKWCMSRRSAKLYT